jgi:nucleotide-binding universal stress UspA family protein
VKRLGRVLCAVDIGEPGRTVAGMSEADVVVVRTQVRSRLGYRVPIIRQVLQEAPCPVLAVPAPKAIVTEHERRPAA